MGECRVTHQAESGTGCDPACAPQGDRDDAGAGARVHHRPHLAGAARRARDTAPSSESPVAGRDVRPARGARRRGVVRLVGVGCCDPPPPPRPARPLPVLSGHATGGPTRTPRDQRWARITTSCSDKCLDPAAPRASPGIERYSQMHSSAMAPSRHLATVTIRPPFSNSPTTHVQSPDPKLIGCDAT